MDILFYIATTLIGLFLGFIWKSLLKKFDELKLSNEAIKNGVLANIRSSLLRYHYDFCEEQDYMPIHIKEVVDIMYEQYVTLGGNGVVPKLYKEMMALPEYSNKRKEVKNGKRRN